MWGTFFNGNIFFKWKLNINVIINYHLLYLCSMLIETSFFFVFKTSSRRLGRRKIVTLKTCWRRLQDMSSRRLEDFLKTRKCLLGCLWICNSFIILKIKYRGNAPKNAKTKKNLEASYIALWKTDLSEQKEFERLVLFKNGVI